MVLSPDGRAFAHLDFGRKWKAPRLSHFSDGSQAHEGLLCAEEMVLQDRIRVALWRPEPRPSLSRPPPVGRRQGERVAGFQTVNPRDDWPQPGCTLEEGLTLLLDGHYAGTTGVSPAPGLHVGADATVVAERCHFEGGVYLEADAELWLVDCTVAGTRVAIPGATLVEF